MYANDNAFVEIEANQGVTIDEFEKQRLARRIQEKVEELKAGNMAARSMSLSLR